MHCGLYSFFTETMAELQVCFLFNLQFLPTKEQMQKNSLFRCNLNKDNILKKTAFTQ